MADKDFIVDLSVDQRGVNVYTSEMDKGAAAVERVATQIESIRFRGLRLNANSRRLSAAMRAEARRRDRDATRVAAQAAKIGEGLQRAVVKEIGVGLRRPTASSGKLAKVTASPRNSSYANRNSRVTIGVGRFSWLLNNKQVAYALAIEGGTRAHIGRRISGLWIASTGRPTGFGRPTKTQRFVSMSAREAAKTLVSAGRRNFRVSGIITQPIVAHGDYNAAVRAYRPEARMLAEIRRIYGA